MFQPCSYVQACSCYRNMDLAHASEIQKIGTQLEHKERAQSMLEICVEHGRNTFGTLQNIILHDMENKWNLTWTCRNMGTCLTEHERICWNMLVEHVLKMSRTCYFNTAVVIDWHIPVSTHCNKGTALRSAFGCLCYDHLINNWNSFRHMASWIAFLTW